MIKRVYILKASSGDVAKQWAAAIKGTDSERLGTLENDIKRAESFAAAQQEQQIQQKAAQKVAATSSNG